MACGRRSRKPKHGPSRPARTSPAEARGWPRPAPYVAAVLIAWGAGLVFSGWHGLGTRVLPLAVVLALPLSAVLAIRTRSALE
jgi:hypothetical protein